jgi:anion-transporting  ArsA/GET3 family ATPase
VTGLLEKVLSRRLLLVTGKGGTGKSTVAAALGVLAARSGVRTVVVELGDSRVLRELFQGPAGAARALASREPEAVAERLFALRIEPMEALREYLELQLRVRLLARAIVDNSAFHRFLEAAPGWRELVTLGKLWYLVSREDGAGRPLWPLVIVDAPATGHGLSLLSVPSVVRDTVRVGPLRHNADRIYELMTDPARTWVVPITLPEELPVRETLELRARVGELGVGLGPVIANGVEPQLALADPERVLAAVARLERDAAPPLAAPDVVRTAARHRLARAALQRGFLAELTRTLGEPARELPWLAQGVDGPEGVGALADALGGALA